MTSVDFRYPDGEVREWTLYGANAKPIFIFSLTEDEEVIAIWQYRHAVDGWVLELPGGNPKPGQSYEEVLRTELLEETGYEPQGTHIFRDRRAVLDPASVRVTGLVGVAWGCRRVAELDLDPTELIVPVLYDLNGWLAMCDGGVVEDMKSVQATRWAWDFLIHKELIQRW
ncbi:MAG: NUDIX hydrolase [Candidatus Liptonbacteria bacterium]